MPPRSCEVGISLKPCEELCEHFHEQFAGGGYKARMYLDLPDTHHHHSLYTIILGVRGYRYGYLEGWGSPTP